MKLLTKRLILRAPTKKDAEDIAKNANNIEVSKWLIQLPYPYSTKDALWWINKKPFEEQQEFCIQLKENGVIGGIGLSHIEKSQGRAEIGYWLGEQYWNQGYASESLAAVLEFAFNKLKLRRIEAGVFIGNLGSERVLQKAGFVKEGLRRKAWICKADKKIKDDYLYALIKQDWKQI